MFKLTKVGFCVNVLQLCMYQGGYDVVETKDSIAIDLFGFIPYLTTSRISLNLRLKVGSKRKLENTTQGSINLLLTSVNHGGNILFLGVQLINMILALEP